MNDLAPVCEHNPQILEHLIDRDSLRIDRLGARIGLRLQGIQILTDFVTKRVDGKPAVTHPCTPVFDNFGQAYELPQHGPARSSLWELVSNTPGISKGKTTIEYNIVGGTYPLGVRVNQTFELADGVFTLTTIHKNTGPKAVPVNYGEHLYWSTNNSGWNDVCLNSRPIADLIAANGQMDLKSSNELIIPGHAVIRLEQEDLSRAVLWSMPHPNSPDYDTHYFCLEPVENPPEDFGKPKTLLRPHQSRKTVLQILLQENIQPTRC